MKYHMKHSRRIRGAVQHIIRTLLRQQTCNTNILFRLSWKTCHFLQPGLPVGFLTGLPDRTVPPTPPPMPPAPVPSSSIIKLTPVPQAAESWISVPTILKFEELVGGLGCAKEALTLMLILWFRSYKSISKIFQKQVQQGSHTWFQKGSITWLQAMFQHLFRISKKRDKQ